MKAYVIKKFGNPSVFEKADVAAPELKAGHVILRVLGTSINPVDSKIRSGALSMLAPDFPAILHGDVVGVVESVGEDVKQFNKGDKVYGFAGGVKGIANGALAELMLANAKLLAKVPAAMSTADAAALPVIGITAWEALFKRLNLKAGQNILIHGGLGGVGHIAVQLAHWAKAKVYTTVRSDADLALAKKLGADFVINAEQENVESYVNRLTDGKGFDLIFDTVGGDNLQRCFVAAATSGVIVTIAARGAHELTMMQAKGLTLHVVNIILPLFTGKNCEIQGQILAELATLVEKDHLKPLLNEKAFTFDEVSQAHTLFETGKARGKIVVLR